MTIHPPEKLWAERTGVRTYLGHNTRGAVVPIGEGPGQFTPGELFKIAFAMCNSMAVDYRLVQTLGEGVDLISVASGTRLDDENRYGELHVELKADLSDLDEQERSKLEQRIQGTVSRQCTLGRTLEHGAAPVVTLTHAGTAAN